MNLKDKRIVVTGGTSGIGHELVKKLAVDNHVIVVSRKGTVPSQWLVGDYPVQLYHADLGKKSDVEYVVDQIQRNNQAIDLLVNNAAMQCTPEFLSEDFNFDAIQTEIDVNFTSVCHLCYLFLPMLLAAHKGVILNVNSGLAIVPKRGSAIYCATKSAMDSFSRSLAYQLEDTSVAVQQVFLPLVETRMTEGRGTGKLKASDVADRIIDGITSGKTVNDVGKVRLLRSINYLIPALARRIMKGG